MLLPVCATDTHADSHLRPNSYVKRKNVTAILALLTYFKYHWQFHKGRDNFTRLAVIWRIIFKLRINLRNVLILTLKIPGYYTYHLL
jgi:hypothetical protein